MARKEEEERKYIERCATHFKSYKATYTKEGDARWEAELMYEDWRQHFPDWEINKEIHQLNNGEWLVYLTATKKECTYAEH